MDPSAPASKRRRKLIVYPRFQLLLVLVNTAAVSLVAGFLIFQFYRFIGNFHEMGVRKHFPEDHAYFRFIQLQQLQFYSDMFLVFAGVLLASAVATILISQRAAGPMVRLREHFRRIARGEKVSPVTFRRADFFQDVPPIVNEAVTALTERKDP